MSTNIAKIILDGLLLDIILLLVIPITVDWLHFCGFFFSIGLTISANVPQYQSTCQYLIQIQFNRIFSKVLVEFDKFIEFI